MDLETGALPMAVARSTPPRSSFLVPRSSFL
jgi:hypothetical protein